MRNKLQHIFIFICFTIMYIFTTPLYSQNCSVDSTGLIPIPDLANVTYQGYQGGLYFGTNTKPVHHINNLNNANSKIKPLNSLGVPDSSMGKIVFLSIGASNPKTEFESFQTITDTFSLLNPYLKIVNGCKGGSGIQKLLDTTDNYWHYVINQLTASAVNRNQVQLIWLEEENTQTSNINFPGAPLALMGEFKKLFNILVQFYPNLQICYLTARGYSGYLDDTSSAGNGLRHPRDYYNGWAMKWLIENQISGDTSLAFTGANRRAPLLDWSAYLWADGKNQRQDGLNWICPVDVKPGDGLHWSPTGNVKAGIAIFQKFYLDAEAGKWFMKKQVTNEDENPETGILLIYPNPSKNYFQIKTTGIEKFDVFIYNNLGQLVMMNHNAGDGDMIYHNLTNGLYYLKIKTGNMVVKTIKFWVHK